MFYRGAYDKETAKHLDFEDISLTKPLSELLPPPYNNRDALGSAEMADIEAQLCKLGRDLVELDASSRLKNIESKAQEDLQSMKELWPDLQSHLWTSRLDYIEVATRKSFLQQLVDSDLHDSLDFNRLFEEQAIALDRLHNEMRETELLSTETVTTCKDLIKMIEEDSNTMEAFHKLAQVRLDACEMKVKEVKTILGQKDSLWESSRKAKQDDVCILRRSVEENLWEKKEILLRADLDTRKLEELQRLIKMRQRYLQEQLAFGSLKNVSIVSMEKQYITLLLQFDFMESNKLNFSNDMKHMENQLLIELDPSTSLLENAQLGQGGISIQEIVSAAKSSYPPISGLYFGKEHQLLEQLEFLVREVMRKVYSQHGEH